MKTFSREITQVERDSLESAPSYTIEWAGVFSAGAGLAVVAGLLAAIVFGIVIRLVDVELGRWYCRGDVVMLLAACAGFLVGSVLTFLHELRTRKVVNEYHDGMRSIEWVNVERHEVKDLKLARVPEHGAPMFFVRCTDGQVLFVFNRQDEPGPDWEQFPTKLRAEDLPRESIEIVRHPKTRQAIFKQFFGKPIQPEQCYLIHSHPSRWPDSGDSARTNWNRIEERFGLTIVKPAGAVG